MPMHTACCQCIRDSTVVLHCEEVMMETNAKDRTAINQFAHEALEIRCDHLAGNWRDLEGWLDANTLVREIVVDTNES